VTLENVTPARLVVIIVNVKHGSDAEQRTIVTQKRFVKQDPSIASFAFSVRVMGSNLLSMSPASRHEQTLAVVSYRKRRKSCFEKIAVPASLLRLEYNYIKEGATQETVISQVYVQQKYSILGRQIPNGTSTQVEIKMAI
jgi:hypothetical protein